MKEINVLSLFDGMSCGQIALERAGIPVKRYLACEIDKYAKKITQKNYPNTYHMGSVTDFRVKKQGMIDLLIGGSPCQGFSFAGDQLNFDDPRSKLFFEYVRILEESKPKYFLLENVRMNKKHQDVISKYLGCEPIEINSDIFVQQNRPRLYWTNINIDKFPKRPLWEGDFYQWRRSYFRHNKSGVCPCLMAAMGTGGNNVPLKSMDKKDKLSPEDCEALQGVTRGYTEGVSNTQRYKMLGNGWTVDVIAHIFKGMKF